MRMFARARHRHAIYIDTSINNHSLCINRHDDSAMRQFQRLQVDKASNDCSQPTQRRREGGERVAGMFPITGHSFVTNRYDGL